MNRCICISMALISTACADGSPTSSDTTETDTTNGSEVPASTGSVSNGTSGGSSSASQDSSSNSGTDTMPSEATRGAVSLHVGPGENCSLADSWVEFPQVDGAHPVNMTEFGPLAEDATRDSQGRRISVTCEWLTEEEPFQIIVAIAAVGDDAWTFSSQPMLEAVQSQPSTLTFKTSDSTPSWRAASEAELCQFTKVEVDLMAGRVWGGVTCPALVNPDNDEVCEVTEGYYYFENCTPRML